MYSQDKKEERLVAINNGDVCYCSKNEGKQNSAGGRQYGLRAADTDSAKSTEQE